MGAILVSLMLWQPITADTVKVIPMRVAGVAGVWLARPVAEYYFDAAARRLPLQRLAIESLVAANDSAQMALGSRRLETVLLRRQLSDVWNRVRIAEEAAGVHRQRAETLSAAYRRERLRGKIMAAGSGAVLVGALVLAVVL